METTVCPWCHTEIVWDEEFGPEETCPHCNNELGGYRTVTISPEDVEDDTEDETDEDAVDESKLWDESEQDGVVPIFNTLEQFRDDYDMNRYASNVSDILASQLEAPECPQCHELLLFAGKQQVGDFAPSVPGVLRTPVLRAPFALNMYVCPTCFHVQHTLASEDREQFVKNLSEQ
ncbi:hypothetical protein [Paenibacillus sp. NFR01]|uniref:hypothetical protein n=1 Tax=Paenibacillus sp. NFR01 TaxID=1566279 RepID=UPI0008B5F2CB|nr:hypothetical protein [Paenibacillus sp. NFR01]SET87288.1 hypothetical protein SAMN03159358_2514 [Paenibacillus sp. NFR01]